MFTHTYCNVDSNARKFPSLPLDHLLTSPSRASATLCQKIKIQDYVQIKQKVNRGMKPKTDRLHFYLLAPSAQDDHGHSFQQELLPGFKKNEQRKYEM